MNRSSSISGQETEYFDRIPVDLFISNILSRLPVKSKAQCRCVSKLWSSMIRRPNYDQLFPIKTPAPPRILFTIDVAGDMLFYSSPQPHNPDKNSSLVATLHNRTGHTKFYKICGPVCGLVCRQYNSVAVIYNPITGESLNLPKLSFKGNIKLSEWLFDKARYSFGYDPIDKQFKVLCITWMRTGSENLSDEYHVLTLGTGNKNLLWRKIQCCTIHFSSDNTAICIDGVLYYPAEIYKGEGTIVCFDVRSEKFSFTNIDRDMALKIKSGTLTLIDYKGKLGACGFDINHRKRLVLWVLEDAKEPKWSKHTYNLNVNVSIHPAGMIGSCQLVLYPSFMQDPFFVFYYNLESNIITRVKLEAPLFKRFHGCRIQAFPNYVEDVKLM
ncbi:F-box domain [Arabidopsis suecica]|uniref:F-box domain n=1 Tax=Arabidopsis suecica TaxID=45249 RepID=A0A8T2CQ22_ARASU|nr:F-box domain [Arabidopsis suecica]